MIEKFSQETEMVNLDYDDKDKEPKKKSPKKRWKIWIRFSSGYSGNDSSVGKAFESAIGGSKILILGRILVIITYKFL